ncbi:hypothetical protein DF140_07610 [Burkholderia cenocepacia]|nr:hypothetical protein DF140_07610 [Burkholderia cenocepacia]
MYRGCGARGRRQARSSARLGRAWRQRGRAGGASGALESAVSHGSVVATKRGWSRSGGGTHARFWCEVEGCYLIGAVIGRAGSCRFRRCARAVQPMRRRGAPARRPRRDSPDSGRISDSGKSPQEYNTCVCCIRCCESAISTARSSSIPNCSA